MPSHQDVYETAITKLAETMRNEIGKEAELTKVSQDALTKAVVAELLGEERFADGRAHEWHVRLWLFDCARPGDPVADSDPKLAPDEPGATTVRSLPAVVKLVVEQASQFHDAVCAGLDVKTLTRKLASLRTQLSYRGDGSGTLRANYEVAGQFGVRHMMLRCDVLRVNKSKQEIKLPDLGFNKVKTSRSPTATVRKPLQPFPRPNT